MSELKKSVQRMIDAGVPEDKIGEFIQTYKLDTVTPEQSLKTKNVGSYTQGHRAGDYARGFFGGFNTGVAGMAGAPVDITNLMLSTVGLGSKEPVGGSEWIKQQAGKVSAIPGAGDPFPKGPDTEGGRIINRTGEEIGASVLPAAGMLRAARGVVPAARTAQRGLIRGQILDPIGRAPGASTVGELAATAGAGAGAGVAKEMLPENTTAETYGQLGGGLLPLLSNLTPTNAARKIYSVVSRRFGTDAQKTMAADAIREILGDTLSGQAGKNLKESVLLGEKIPKFKPSLAESTGSPSLVAQQKDFESNATREVLDNLVLRRENNLNEIDRFANNITPQTDLSPEYIIDSASGRLKSIGATVDRLAAKNLKNQKDLASGIAKIDNLEVGASIRSAIMDAKNNASVKMSVRAEELGLNDVDLSAKFKGWAAELEQKYAPKSVFEDPRSVPEIYKKTLSVAGDKTTESISFADIKAIRERINDDIIKSLSPVNIDRRKVRFLVRMKKDVDGLLNGLDSELGQSYATFRKEYLDNYVKPFESGSVFKSKSKDGTGFYKVADEKIADLFLDSQSAAKQFNSIFGDDPEMMGAMFSSAADRLGKDTIVDGVIDQNKYKSFMKKHNTVLDEFPSIKKSFNDIETAQNTLWDRQSQLATRRIGIENNALAKKLTSYSEGKIPAENILNSAISNPKQMEKLVQYVGRDNDALDALRRTYWQNASQQDSVGVLKFLETNKSSLSKLYSPQHLRDMYDVSAMKAMMERVPVSGGKAYKMEPMKGFEDLTGMAVPQAGTRYWAFMSRRVPRYYLVFDVVKSALYKKSQRHFNELLGTALYDPSVAREMADGVRAVRFTEKKAKRLGARLFSLGIPYLKKDEGE